MSDLPDLVFRLPGWQLGGSVTSDRTSAGVPSAGPPFRLRVSRRIGRQFVAGGPLEGADAAAMHAQEHAGADAGSVPAPHQRKEHAMQLATSGPSRLAGVSDLHSPPHIHSPPNTRLRVAAAKPFDPTHVGGGLQVTSLPVRADGTTGEPLADAAIQAASRVEQVLAQRFGRDGIDGRGGSIELVVHAPDATNAYWDRTAQRIELGDGDGVRWGAFARSTSVVAHELYHGVVDAEVRLDYDQPEQAALQESFADVFAAGVVGSWRIGEDVVTPTVSGDAIRDLEHPDVANVSAARRAGGEPHALSGVASLAAVRAADAIGGEAMQRVWYSALVDHLRDGAGFTDAARATVAAAGDLFGAGSRERRAVAQAWASVGVLDDGPTGA
jgi:hypothetical protein